MGCGVEGKGMVMLRLGKSVEEEKFLCNGGWMAYLYGRLLEKHELGRDTE